VAVTAGMLSLAGGNFPLTAQVDFGTSFGIKVKSILTETVNPSTAGYIALAKTDTIDWRNNANSANLALGIDGSNNLTFNGSPIGLTALTDNHIYVGNASNVPTDVAMSGDATIVASGALTIANGAITDAKVASGAAIAVSKLAALTASRAVQTGVGGLLEVSAVTTTELGYLSGTTSNIQTQLGTYLPLAGGTMSGAISMASNKITSLANGSSAGDAVAFNQVPVFTAWASFTPSFGGMGTVSGVAAFWRQEATSVHVRGHVISGSVTASAVTISLPNGTTINNSSISANDPAGIGWNLVAGASTPFGSNNIFAIFVDGVATTTVFVSKAAAGNVFVKSTGTNLFTSGDSFAFDFQYPI